MSKRVGNDEVVAIVSGCDAHETCNVCGTRGARLVLQTLVVSFHVVAVDLDLYLRRKCDVCSRIRGQGSL